MEPHLEALAAEILGPRFAGRRYLRYGDLEALGIVGNRATLKLWIDAGGFPRGIRIAGPYGRTLVWSVPEVVRALAQRVAERDTSPNPENEKGAPVLGERPSDSKNAPLQTGRGHEHGEAWYPPTSS